MTADNENELDSGFDSGRRLCPDGACVGIIGSDGKCSECGRAASGEPAADEAVAREADADDAAESATRSPDDGAFDPNRQLCRDDACIGVIGDDGRCKMCGKPA
jgi:hypothetical protein